MQDESFYAVKIRRGTGLVARTQALEVLNFVETTHICVLPGLSVVIQMKAQHSYTKGASEVKSPLRVGSREAILFIIPSYLLELLTLGTEFHYL